MYATNRFIIDVTEATEPESPVPAVTVDTKHSDPEGGKGRVGSGRPDSPVVVPALVSQPRTFLVKGSPGSPVANDVIINVDEINAHLMKLKKHHNTMMRELPEDAKGSLNFIKHHVQILGSVDMNKMLADEIDKVFGEFKSPSPGTVAAYLVGCSTQTNYSPGNPACAPNCIGNLQPGATFEAQSPCGHASFMLTDTGEFIRIGGPLDTKDAEIVVIGRDSNFKLTPKQLQDLRVMGFTRFRLVNQINTRNYNALNADFMNIDQHISHAGGNQVKPRDVFIGVPAVAAVPVAATAQKPSNFSWWILLIVIIIAIVLLAFYFYNANKKKQAAELRIY
jgi:hypothetical protein